MADNARGGIVSTGKDMDHRPEHDPPEPADEPITELAIAYTDALLAGDEMTAEQVLRDAMDAGLSPAEINDGVIAPAMWRVGELWMRGQLSIAQEHLATEITTRLLAFQREAHRVAESRRDHSVVLATPSSEQHVVALRMVANLLRDAGYHVVMLGADVPPESLVDAAERYDAHVICMSSTMPGRVYDVIHAIDAVRDRRPSARFVIGGRGITGEGHLRPEVHVCRRVSEAVEAVDAALQRAGMN